MIRTPLALVALVSIIVGGPLAAQRSSDAPAPTRVVRFVPPATLPARVQSGSCWTTSSAAWYHAGAFRCMVDNAISDPCFSTSREGQVLCVADPREASSGFVIALTSPLPAPRPSASADNHAWFFELTDGSTCQPFTGTRREIDGKIEVYYCQFGSAGNADAVLGELDASTAVWTIQKVLLNKKVEPMTVKSLMVAAVKTVWQ